MRAVTTYILYKDCTSYGATLLSRETIGQTNDLGMTMLESSVLALRSNQVSLRVY